VVVGVEALDRLSGVQLAARGLGRGASTQTDSNSDDGIVPTGILVDHGA
jgi:hypothetical protein